MKIAILNKADNLKALNVGQRVADLLEKGGSSFFDRIIIGELEPNTVNTVIHECRVVAQKRIQ